MTKIVANNSAAVFPVGSVLGVAFVVLKLVGVIDWSWWWVTAPFWAPTAALLAITAALMVVGGLFLGAAKLVNR